MRVIRRPWQPPTRMPSRIKPIKPIVLMMPIMPLPECRRRVAGVGRACSRGSIMQCSRPAARRRAAPCPAGSNTPAFRLAWPHAAAHAAGEATAPVVHVAPVRLRPACRRRSRSLWLGRVWSATVAIPVRWRSRWRSSVSRISPRVIPWPGIAPTTTAPTGAPCTSPPRTARASTRRGLGQCGR